MLVDISKILSKMKLWKYGARTGAVFQPYSVPTFFSFPENSVDDHKSIHWDVHFNTCVKIDVDPLPHECGKPDEQFTISPEIDGWKSYLQQRLISWFKISNFNVSRKLYVFTWFPAVFLKTVLKSMFYKWSVLKAGITTTTTRIRWLAWYHFATVGYEEQGFCRVVRHLLCDQVETMDTRCVSSSQLCCSTIEGVLVYPTTPCCDHTRSHCLKILWLSDSTPSNP